MKSPASSPMTAPGNVVRSSSPIPRRPAKALLDFFRGGPEPQSEKTLAIQAEHGQNRAKLYGYFKRGGLGSGKTESLSRQNEMSCGRNRQKFGQAFHQTEQNGS